MAAVASVAEKAVAAAASAQAAAEAAAAAAKEAYAQGSTTAAATAPTTTVRGTDDDHALVAEDDSAAAVENDGMEAEDDAAAAVGTATTEAQHVERRAVSQALSFAGSPEMDEAVRALGNKRDDPMRAQFLKNAKELPLVFLEVGATSGGILGRVEIVLFAYHAPLATENLLQLVKGGGAHHDEHPFKALHIGQQGGALLVPGRGPSAYGGPFQDDQYALVRLRHNRKGLLSMDHAGLRNSNGAAFRICTQPASIRDQRHVIFGEVVSGFDVLTALSEPGTTTKGVIQASGVIRPGTALDTPALHARIVAEQRRVSARLKLPISEARRLAALAADPGRPIVYMEVSIHGTYAGRMEAVLFPQEAPLWTENFYLMCSGAGIIRKGLLGAGGAYRYHGSFFYRLSRDFVLQAGAPGIGSPLGGMFSDDQGGRKLKHSRPYLLTSANNGSKTNTNHFAITMGPWPHLNWRSVIFGELIDGHDVAQAINAIAATPVEGRAEDVHNTAVEITGCGSVQRGRLTLTTEYRAFINKERRRIERAGAELIPPPGIAIFPRLPNATERAASEALARRVLGGGGGSKAAGKGVQHSGGGGGTKTTAHGGGGGTKTTAHGSGGKAAAAADKEKGMLRKRKDAVLEAADAAAQKENGLWEYEEDEADRSGKKAAKATAGGRAGEGTGAAAAELSKPVGKEKKAAAKESSDDFE